MRTIWIFFFFRCLVMVRQMGSLRGHCCWLGLSLSWGSLLPLWTWWLLSFPCKLTYMILCIVKYWAYIPQTGLSLSSEPSNISFVFLLKSFITLLISGIKFPLCGALLYYLLYMFYFVPFSQVLLDVLSLCELSLCSANSFTHTKLEAKVQILPLVSKCVVYLCFMMNFTSFAPFIVLLVTHENQWHLRYHAKNNFSFYVSY